MPALGLLQRGVQRALLGANGGEIQPRTTMPMIFTHEGGGHCSFLWAAEPRRTRLATSESPNHTATPSPRERLHSPRPQLGRPCWSSPLSTVTMSTQLCKRCPPHQPMKSLQHRLQQERKVLQRPHRFGLRCAVGTGEREDSPRTCAAWRHAHLDDHIMHESDFQPAVFNEDDDLVWILRRVSTNGLKWRWSIWCASASAT